jgi:hypothetical protein
VSAVGSSERASSPASSALDWRGEDDRRRSPHGWAVHRRAPASEADAPISPAVEHAILRRPASL